MKKMLSLGSVFTLSLLLASYSTTPRLQPGDRKIEVFFNNKLSFNDLVKMKSDLSRQQIELDYQLLELLSSTDKCNIYLRSKNTSFGVK